jgi:hypothetical protein
MTLVPVIGRRRVASGAACAIALVCTAVAIGCGGNEPRSWGEAVDRAQAVPLSEILSGDRVDTGEAVTVSGRIGEVCRTTGCWFVLRDRSNGGLSEVMVDLKPRATFTVPQDVQGHKAVVRGHLVGQKPDLRFDAVGLLVE